MGVKAWDIPLLLLHFLYIGSMNQVGCLLLPASQRFAAIAYSVVLLLAWERLRFLRLHYRDPDLLAVFTFLVSVPLFVLLLSVVELSLNMSTS